MKKYFGFITVAVGGYFCGQALGVVALAGHPVMAGLSAFGYLAALYGMGVLTRSE